MTLYFKLLLFTISFPLLASWDKRFNYASKFKFLFPSIFITGSFFIVWDIIFTQNGVWGFSETHTSNINILSLPIEEWLFFIIIPFSCVFIYESVKYFFDINKSKICFAKPGDELSFYTITKEEHENISKNLSSFKLESEVIYG